jgi:hypothetical protein
VKEQRSLAYGVNIALAIFLRVDERAVHRHFEEARDVWRRRHLRGDFAAIRLRLSDGINDSLGLRGYTHTHTHTKRPERKKEKIQKNSNRHVTEKRTKPQEKTVQLQIDKRKKKKNM